MSVNSCSIQYSKKEQKMCANFAFLGEESYLLRQLATDNFIRTGATKMTKSLLKKQRNSINTSVLKSEMV